MPRRPPATALTVPGDALIFPPMSVVDLFLYFLACGAATFPLALSAVAWIVPRLAPTRVPPTFAKRMEDALALSLVAWIVGAMVFYAVALHIERQKPCLEQHTNQLTEICKKELNASDR
jgi:hypothetical protein